MQAHDGSGIPAMHIAYELAADHAVEKGLETLAVLSTGRIGWLAAFG